MLIIRGQQLHVLSDNLRERSLKAFLRQRFPEECAALGATFDSVIRRSLDRTAAYEMFAFRDVLRYAILVIALGERFESLPDNDWAAEILNDRNSQLSGQRGVRLIKTAVRYMAQEERTA